jgi:hypothetical protein
MTLTLELLKFSQVMRNHMFMTYFHLSYYFDFLSYFNFTQRKAMQAQNIDEKSLEISKRY